MRMLVQVSYPTKNMYFDLKIELTIYIIKYLEFVKNVLLLPRSTMLFTTHGTYLGLFRYNIFMEETDQCIKHQT